MVRTVAKFFVKNVAGYSLFAAGALLCLPMVPGPGTVLIFAGLALADWPGKAYFFRWLHSFEWFAKIDDWFHGKFGVRMPERDYHRSRQVEVVAEACSDQPQFYDNART